MNLCRSLSLGDTFWIWSIWWRHYNGSDAHAHKWSCINNQNVFTYSIKRIIVLFFQYLCRFESWFKSWFKSRFKSWWKICSCPWKFTWGNKWLYLFTFILLTGPVVDHHTPASRDKNCCSVPKLYLTLWDPIDYSFPGSSVHGHLQARILEWVAISSSRGSSQLRDQTWISCIAGGFFTIWATRQYSFNILESC